MVCAGPGRELVVRRGAAFQSRPRWGTGDHVASIGDPGVRALLERPNYGVVSTLNPDGSIHSAVVWVGVEGDTVAVNSAVDRVWPTNLEHDPRVTLLVADRENPYDYVEIRGRAQGTIDGADEHIDRLAKKYLGRDTYPRRAPGEQRITYVITPERVRHVKR